MKIALYLHLFAGATPMLTAPFNFAPESITEAIEGSKITLNFRSRFEEVKVEGIKDRELFLLKARLNLSSGELQTQKELK